jgi:hypothetical protein
VAARFEWGALVDASGVPEWLRAAARKGSD